MIWLFTSTVAMGSLLSEPTRPTAPAAPRPPRSPPPRRLPLSRGHWKCGEVEAGVRPARRAPGGPRRRPRPAGRRRAASRRRPAAVPPSRCGVRPRPAALLASRRAPRRSCGPAATPSSRCAAPARAPRPSRQAARAVDDEVGEEVLGDPPVQHAARRDASRGLRTPRAARLVGQPGRDPRRPVQVGDAVDQQVPAVAQIAYRGGRPGRLSAGTASGCGSSSARRPPVPAGPSAAAPPSRSCTTAACSRAPRRTAAGAPARPAWSARGPRTSR